MTTNKSAIEQLEEFKAAALLSVWRERLLDIDKKDQRIKELEEEVKNLGDDTTQLMKQRNEYAQQAREALAKCTRADGMEKDLRDMHALLGTVMGEIRNAPANIKNYFAKKGIR